jgi:VWFA-related protein
MHAHRIGWTTVLFLTALPALAQQPEPILYKIEKEGRVLVSNRAGRLYVTVQFKITRAGDAQHASDVAKEEIVVQEDGRRVGGLEIYRPQSLDALTTVLAIDISGSMAERGKLAEAKQAAQLFLTRLHGKADCGLILFDHLLQVQERPIGNPQRFAAHRQHLLRQIAAAQPGGGTAYLDATAEAVAMLRGIKGRKAVLILTDGVDLNSRRTLNDVTQLAQASEVPVYTVGVGEPGKKEPVTTVLVLDRSGSMKDPAEETDRITKMQALHRAAGRFVDLMRPGAQTTLLSFSDRVDQPQAFSANKVRLKQDILRLQPKGQTALFDAIYTALETLDGARPPGKRAVVVLTDGFDNRSRRRVEEVVARARQAEIPLHLLGLGAPGELDELVMQEMAQATGGTYHHARNEQKLFEIFENLAIQLHDDGIDEPALRTLAEETGGKYYPARDISRLPLIYEELVQELQKTYTVTFPSYRQTHDGTSRDIDIRVERRGVRVSETASFGYNVHGVVVPEMDHRVYLALLVGLVSLLALPSGIRRLYRFYGGT